MGLKVSKCIVCRGESFRPYSSGVIQCESCRLVVAEEIPTAKEVRTLYQKEYFFGMEYFDYEADRPALEYNFKKRIASMSSMIKPDYTIVEVGCAYGYFLNMVKRDVKSHLGFDVSRDGVDYAKKQLGVNATTRDFLRYEFTPNSVDSVFMWDVVEHLSFPEEYIEKISQILKPGGKVALTTGNVDSLVPRIRKGKWRMIHPPTHVYYFSVNTITRLLNKHGFSVQTVKHRAVSRNTGSVFNQIIGNRKALNKGVGVLNASHGLATLTRIDKLNFPMNTFDIMEVVAVKN